GIRIASIRMLEHRIRLSPNEAIKKVYIIEQADKMTNQAANAFLKTLEEPPADTVIILTSSKPSALLPTILSRCQKIPFQSISAKIIEQELLRTRNISQVQARLYSKIANGNMAKAFRLAEENSLDTRESMLAFVNIIKEKNDIKFLEFCTKFGNKKSQAQLAEIISQLIIWICDISYLIHYPDALVNLDQEEMLRNMYNLNPHIDNQTPEIIEFLDTMLAKLDGHVNPQLILIGVYNKFINAFHNN
ncbi:MAG: hypothetical protein KAS49_03025, partial [Candidatus Cloacimonetes bacterium]|nr:hypothetical protein [Candidatus Cloacimonadota bacterium]